MADLAAAATPEWTRFLPALAQDTVDETVSVRFSRGHAGQSVLVTGAGGYIASALVKAIAAAGPAASPSRIVLLDSSEHNLFEIQQHLQSAFSDVPCEPVLGSVDDVNLVDDIFTRFQPVLRASIVVGTSPINTLFRTRA